MHRQNFGYYEKPQPQYIKPAPKAVRVLRNVRTSRTLEICMTVLVFLATLIVAEILW